VVPAEGHGVATAASVAFRTPARQAAPYKWREQTAAALALPCAGCRRLHDDICRCDSDIVRGRLQYIIRRAGR